jgi:hypothetical protein
MKLTINEYAPYLPYGLKYKLPLESERFESIMENEPFRLALTLMDEKDKLVHFKEYEKMYLYQELPQIMYDDGKLFLGQMQSSLGFEEDDVYLSEVKPLLRPLSDLTKEIEVNGEKFVPIVKLGVLYFPKSEIENGGVLIEELVYKDNEFKNYFQDYNYIGDNVNLYYKNIGYSESVKIQQQLFQWHFDVFGLIEKGLAINLNSIK